MNAHSEGTLVRLSESGEAVSTVDADIRGRDVRDRDGEDLGKVKDLLIDQHEHKVRLIEVASGGFLGIGQDRTFVPVDAITAITDDEVRIDQTREHVAGAPVYDPDLVHGRDAYGGIFDYYGVVPFWTDGYAYPAFPFYR